MFVLNSSKDICVVGLGYVGLPLAVEFGKHRPVVGFDINPKRIPNCMLGKTTRWGVRLSSSRPLARCATATSCKTLRAARFL